MFCRNCGAQIPEGAGFCGNCGTAVAPAAPAAPAAPVAPATPTPVAPPPAVAPVAPTPVAAPVFQTPVAAPAAPVVKKKKTGLIVGLSLGGVALVGIIVAVILILVLGGGRGANTPEAVVAQYLQAMANANGGETIVSLIPDQVVRQAEREAGMSRSAMVRSINEELRDTVESLEEDYGRGYKITVDSQSVTKWEQYEIENYNSRLEYYGLSVQVQDGARVRTTATIKGPLDRDTDTETMTVVKVDGKWYLDILETDLF